MDQSVDDEFARKHNQSGRLSLLHLIIRCICLMYFLSYMFSL